MLLFAHVDVFALWAGIVKCKFSSLDFVKEFRRFLWLKIGKKSAKLGFTSANLARSRPKIGKFG